MSSVSLFVFMFSFSPQTLNILSVSSGVRVKEVKRMIDDQMGVIWVLRLNIYDFQSSEILILTGRILL